MIAQAPASQARSKARSGRPAVGSRGGKAMARNPLRGNARSSGGTPPSGEHPPAVPRPRVHAQRLPLPSPGGIPPLPFPSGQEPRPRRRGTPPWGRGAGGLGRVQALQPHQAGRPPRVPAGRLPTPFPPSRGLQPRPRPHRTSARAPRPDRPSGPSAPGGRRHRARRRQGPGGPRGLGPSLLQGGRRPAVARNHPGRPEAHLRSVSLRGPVRPVKPVRASRRDGMGGGEDVQGRIALETAQGVGLAHGPHPVAQIPGPGGVGPDGLHGALHGRPPPPLVGDGPHGTPQPQATGPGRQVPRAVPLPPSPIPLHLGLSHCLRPSMTSLTGPDALAGRPSDPA